MWNERYRADDYVYGKEPNDFVRDTVKDLPVGDVLCLADGEGRNGVHLAELGHRVTSVDLSEVGLTKAQQLAAERNVALITVVADLAEFDLGEEAWDLIISVFAHLPPDVRRPLYRRVGRALRPGGRLVLEGYTIAQIGKGTGGPPVPEMMYSLAELTEDLEGLVIEHAVELDREVNEGSGHTGTGSVVQVIATRPA